MGLELLKRLDASAVDLSFKRYHQQSTTAVFKGGNIVEKTDKSGKPAMQVTLEYETEAVIQDMDGGKLNPGSTLKQTLWIPTDGSEQAEWRLKDLAFVAIALGHPRPKEGEPAPMPDDEDKGKRVNLYLTYKPSKDDPNDLAKGNQQFRVSAVKAA